MSHLDDRLCRAPIVTMCDIDNPLCGTTGAAAVFGPQKGASPAQVKMLDAGLAHLAEVIERDLGVDVLHLPGAAAAGGMGAGMVAFFGSTLQMGIQTVLDTACFDDLVREADVVFSGEGCFDAQSLHGKVVVGVAGRCKQAGKPLVAVAGVIDDTVRSQRRGGGREPPVLHQPHRRAARGGHPPPALEPGPHDGAALGAAREHGARERPTGADPSARAREAGVGGVGAGLSGSRRRLASRAPLQAPIKQSLSRSW